MKISISYPPLRDERTPTLGQNRQFQWFHNPSFIYPMVPASAATLLNSQGHDVLWNDAIAMRWTPGRFKEFLLDERPDLLLFETKTPVVKRHWELVRDIKEYLPEMKAEMVAWFEKYLPAAGRFGSLCMAALSPIFWMASLEGPMKWIPQLSNTSAKWVFSERNP